MLYVLSLLIYGVFVGVVAKRIRPGDEPLGLLPSLTSGIVGSFVGGLINYFVLGSSEIKLSGFVMSVIGAVIFFEILKWYSSKNA